MVQQFSLMPFSADSTTWNTVLFFESVRFFSSMSFSKSSLRITFIQMMCPSCRVTKAVRRSMRRVGKKSLRYTANQRFSFWSQRGMIQGGMRLSSDRLRAALQVRPNRTHVVRKSMLRRCTQVGSPWGQRSAWGVCSCSKSIFGIRRIPFWRFFDIFSHHFRI